MLYVAKTSWQNGFCRCVLQVPKLKMVNVHSDCILLTRYAEKIDVCQDSLAEEFFLWCFASSYSMKDAPASPTTSFTELLVPGHVFCAERVPLCFLLDVYGHTRLKHNVSDTLVHFFLFPWAERGSTRFLLLLDMMGCT